MSKTPRAPKSNKLLCKSSSFSEFNAKHMLKMLVEKYGCTIKSRPKLDTKTGKWIYSYYDNI